MDPNAEPIAVAGSYQFELATRDPLKATAELLLLPLFEGPSGPDLRRIEQALGTDLAQVLRQSAVTGQIGDLFLVPSLGRLPCGVLGFVGLGRESEISTESVRIALMRSSDRIAAFTSIATTLHWVGGRLSDFTRAVVEGMVVGSYRFVPHGSLRSPERHPVKARVELLCDQATLLQVRQAASAAGAYGDATNWARDLVNSPPNEMTPAAMAANAQALVGDKESLECRIWTLPELVEAGFGAIVAVGAGSRNEPRLIELKYLGNPGGPWVAIAGKGVTFDSGGLDIKQFDNLLWMKADMAGGAATLAAVYGIARLGLAVNVIAAVPAVENAIGPDAYRPGDVIRHRNGKTTEIVSTDAEGRLILGDTLAYLAEKKPIAIIDLATLTSAILGDETSALFGTSQLLTKSLIEAADEVGEPLWELPLLASCRRYIESPVADLKNFEPGIACGTVVGALFLREFIGSMPWAHIDIVGTAYTRRSTGAWPVGGTGAGTRTLLRFLETMAEKPPAKSAPS